MTSRAITKIKDCIPAIEMAGYKFSHYNRPWYVFTPVVPRDDGRTYIPFTLSEIRDAYNHGW